MTTSEILKTMSYGKATMQKVQWLLKKKIYNQGKCLNNKFYGCFTRRTSFLIFITAHTQKKKIDKVFLFIFY